MNPRYEGVVCLSLFFDDWSQFILVALRGHTLSLGSRDRHRFYEPRFSWARLAKKIHLLHKAPAAFDSLRSNKFAAAPLAQTNA